MKPEGADVITLHDNGDVADKSDVPVLRESGTDEAKLPERAKSNDDGSVTLPLLFPVTLQFRKGSTGDIVDEQFDELKLHRLNGEDMIAIMSAGVGQSAVVSIARSARMSPAKMTILYKRMDGSDIFAVGEVVSFFLSAGRTTGR